MLLACLGVVSILAAPGVATAGHPIEVYLLDVDGNAITAGGPARPYSPKQTCGACHDYESGPALVTKQQTVGGTANAPYDVKVATHGASAGYHFQQGMNAAWGDAQRSFYKLPSFTSSPGMVGKY